ncbi:MAG: hypothetical protein GY801_04845 [bacterium]|nr:hypothetical protein [bacterium]
MDRTVKAMTWGLLGVFLFISGCATIVSDSSYPITFNSDPEQTTITVNNSRGEEIYTGKTPTIVTLNSGAGFFKGERYTVTFVKEGYEEHIAYIESTMDGWYIGNLAFGGLLGLLIIDPLTGAMWRLEPEQVSASLTPKTSSVDNYEEAIQFVLLENVPEHLRSKMIQIQ